MHLTAKQVAECLARIVKIPEAWRHPRIRYVQHLGLWLRWSGIDERGDILHMIDQDLALDLHIGHMAKRLSSMDHDTTKLKNGLWTNSVHLTDDGWKEILPTYEEAVISAAQALLS